MNTRWRTYSLVLSLALLVMCFTAATPPPQVSHVQMVATADQNNGAASKVLTTLTASVNVKTSAGNVYGIYALNGAASTCFLQLINSSGAGTIGTGVVASIPLPASTTTPVYIPLNPPVGGFANGIAAGIATTASGATPCGTGGNVTVVYQ